MEKNGVSDEPGTAVQSPTTESAGPDGGGVSSGTSEGGNKLDPISAGPTIGHTIAGRTGETGIAGSAAGDTSAERAGGTTGMTGREAGEGRGTTRSAAVEDINPGDAKTG